jgi:hypothetical protein
VNLTGIDRTSSISQTRGSEGGGTHAHLEKDRSLESKYVSNVSLSGNDSMSIVSLIE